MEGGTTLTVRGTDLGVTFADIQGSTLTLGGRVCTPLSINYIPGQQFVCETTNLGTSGPKDLSLTIGVRVATVTVDSFSAVVPTVSEVSPSLGPVAGGTVVSIMGTGLAVGNQENTIVDLALNGASYVCSIKYVTILN